jgi:hypothetical protein
MKLVHSVRSSFAAISHFGLSAIGSFSRANSRVQVAKGIALAELDPITKQPFPSQLLPAAASARSGRGR